MLEIIITSSVLILAILLIRKICWGKISRRMQYGLWILVVIRLLVPAQFLVSPISIMQLAEYGTRQDILQSEEKHFVNTEDEEQNVSQSGKLQGLQPNEEQKTGQEQQQENISVIPSSNKQQTVEELYESNDEQIVNEGEKVRIKAAMGYYYRANKDHGVWYLHSRYSGDDECDACLQYKVPKNAL